MSDKGQRSLQVPHKQPGGSRVSQLSLQRFGSSLNVVVGGVRCSSAVPADAFVDGSISSFSQLLQTHVGVSSSKPQRWFLLTEKEASQRGSSCTTGSRLQVQTQEEASSPSGSLWLRARCPWHCRSCSVWNQ